MRASHLITLLILFSLGAVVCPKTKNKYKSKGRGFTPKSSDPSAFPEKQSPNSNSPMPPLLPAKTNTPEVKLALELQEKIQAIHKDDPRSTIDLGFMVLSKAFERFHKKRGGAEIPVSLVLEQITQVPSKTSLYILRLLSFMDGNNDYIITKEEFASFLMGPVSSPDRLFGLMFRLKDFNGDGTLTKYEAFWSEVMGVGMNYNLLDLWHTVNLRMSEMEIIDDGLVDLGEYKNFAIFQISKALVDQRLAALAAKMSPPPNETKKN